MHLTSALCFLLSIAPLSGAMVIPVGSPDGLYSGHTNNTGHEVLVYHGTLDNLQNLDLLKGPGPAKRDEASGRQILSARAAALARASLSKRDYASCGPYTGINYQPAVDSLANWCGGSSAFSGYLGFMSNGAIAYACDYGNGNRCDHNTIENVNGGVSDWCGPNANGWWNIPEYKLSFGRTQAGTCFCSC